MLVQPSEAISPAKKPQVALAPIDLVSQYLAFFTKPALGNVYCKVSDTEMTTTQDELVCHFRVEYSTKVDGLWNMSNVKNVTARIRKFKTAWYKSDILSANVVDGGDRHTVTIPIKQPKVVDTLDSLWLKKSTSTTI